MRRVDDHEPARPVAAAAPLPPAPAAPAAPAKNSAASSANNFSAPARTANPDEVELPLAAVVAALPLDLRAKLMTAPPASQTIRLQAETVISQLAFGSVKISFGELRQLAPGLFANSGGEMDSKLVSLPLHEILPRINTALLARRPVKKVEVAAEISGPFADRGRGFSFTTQPLKAPAATPPAAKPEPVSPTAFGSPVTPRQVTPPPVAPQFPTRSITPAAPTSGNGNGHSLPASPLTPRSVTPATNGGNGSNGHGLALPPGLRLASTNGHGANALPPTAKISAAPAPAALRPEPGQPMIFAVLGELCEHWPVELKDEILASPLARASVPLDGGIILPGLKRGRVAMTWKQLRTLAQPSSSASPQDHLELELPLKVIAPLFLAAQKNSAKPQTKAAVSAEIPDLFFGFPQPAAAPVAPALPQLPKPAEAKNADTNYFLRDAAGQVASADTASLRKSDVPQTDFLNRQAHPKEVVARATALPGVAGSVVAMQDGLRVASQVPADLNADTLAAFLPQIFERVNQSTRELRMGVLNNINFTVGSVAWKIFRVNSVYFAAFGKAGEQLPSAQLAQLAAELDRKKQK